MVLLLKIFIFSELILEGEGEEVVVLAAVEEIVGAAGVVGADGEDGVAEAEVEGPVLIEGVVAACVGEEVLFAEGGAAGDDADFIDFFGVDECGEGGAGFGCDFFGELVAEEEWNFEVVEAHDEVCVVIGVDGFAAAFLDEEDFHLERDGRGEVAVDEGSGFDADFVVACELVAIDLGGGEAGYEAGVELVGVLCVGWEGNAK